MTSLRKIVSFPCSVVDETAVALGLWFREFFYDFHSDEFDDRGYWCARLIIRYFAILAAIGLIAIAFE